MQVNTGSNNPLGLTGNSPKPSRNLTVDESRFVPQGELPESSRINNGEATVFFAQQTPKEAWQQYAFSTSGSMIETSSAIPAGYRDVSSQIETILTEHGLHAQEGMTIKFGIKELEEVEIETEESKIPVFIVENISDDELTEEIEKLLNNSENDHFKQSYLALDKLTTAENSQLAHQRDNVTGPSVKMNINGAHDIDSIVTYGYKQDFSMRFDDNKWMMDAVVKYVELMRLDKVLS